ncbi:MAG: hypothetical protein Q8N09_11150 [Thermodesulfovibrionia bacterium]|nr:hypothetical protein [Thermodesulfovibrionia bacterium]
MDISKKILSDPINKWVFKTAQELNTDIYIVGGYMRDLLRGLKSNDKDFALKSKVEDIARKITKKFNGTFIVLKHKQTYRVVLKNKEMLDFSYLNGSINNDLKGRDFTIDAIAWSPKTEIIDPFSGRNDLNKRIIKAVMIKNLLNDPLRIIRAYRIAAELGFKIETNTREYLKIYSPKITKAASERITEEFFKILSNKNSVKYINECHNDKVLTTILFKNNNKKIRALSKNIKFLNEFDMFLKKQHADKKMSKYLDEEISQRLNRHGLLRLSILTENYSITNICLKVSNNINKALKDIHNGMEISTGKISDTELYKIFNASGERIFEISFLLAFISKKNIKEIFKRANEYLKIKNKILLNGDDVQRILNIEPGIKVGNILATLQEEKFKGTIKTRAEARKWLLSNFT